MTELSPEERVAKLAEMFGEAATELLSKAEGYKADDGAYPGKKALALCFAMGLAGAAVSALVAADLDADMAARLVSSFAQTAAESIE